VFDFFFFVVSKKRRLQIIPRCYSRLFECALAVYVCKG
jgi:hypothetical protein